MYVDPFSEKAIIKEGKDLVKLHKRCITDYLITYYNLKLKHRRKFEVIYDHYINEENIRHYFFRPIKLFIYYLIINDLNQIKDFKHGFQVNPTKRRKKRKVKTCSTKSDK